MNTLHDRFPRYSQLLRLYPGGYRKEYSEQMLQTLADMLDDPARHRAAVWFRAALDFPFSVLHQQLAYAGEAMNTTPRYMKWNAQVGAWMITPFFVFVTLNSLLHNQLQHSWVWHTQALYIWLIVLPGMAILLNTAALLRWIMGRRRESGSLTWKLLTDFRRNWPALVIIVVGLGILALVFGHDSVHCVAGNPFRELHNPHATWQCVERG